MMVFMTKQKDDVERYIAKRAEKSPDFPQLVEAATRRRALIHSLADRRVALDLSQTEIAARMGTSQAAVARIESGEHDLKMSTIERYATAIDASIDYVVRGPKPRTRERSAA